MASSFMPRTTRLLTPISVAACLLLSGATAAQTASIARPPASSLTPQQARGENLFLQRCSVCHLRRQLKFGAPPTNGPSLKGLFRTDDAEQQQRLLEQIRNGSPNMPGFRYGLNPRQIDDLISYLKVF